jgi:hypothetical protein
MCHPFFLFLGFTFDISMKFFLILLLGEYLICDSIYVEIGGNGNSDCGTSVSTACSTFSVAYQRMNGTSFILFYYLLIYYFFRNTFYFGAGTFITVIYYNYFAGTNTFFLGTVDDNGIVCTHLSTTASSYGFFYSTNATISVSNMNFTYQSGNIYYSSGAQGVFNLTNCVIVRESNGMYLINLHFYCFFKAIFHCILWWRL